MFKLDNRGKYSSRDYPNNASLNQSLVGCSGMTVICGVCQGTHAQKEAAEGLGPVHNVCVGVSWVHHRMGVALREQLRRPSIKPLKESV